MSMNSENITIVRLPIEVDKLKETKIIAMKGDDPVGHVGVQFAGKTTAAILQLYVVPHMRKRGIGSMLVNKAIEIAQMHGCEAVGLSLAANNYLAWKLYKSLGFIRGYQYDDGSWLVCKSLLPDYRAIKINRAVSGLKHCGSFRRTCGEGPHPLDCTLAGRVSHVFGVGMTSAIQMCRDAGEDPEWKSSPCDAFDDHAWVVDEDDQEAVCSRCGVRDSIDVTK